MNLNVWQDKASILLRDRYMLEARRRHFLQQPPLTLEAWQTRREALIAQIRSNAGLGPYRPSDPDRLRVGTRPGSESPLEMRVHGVIRLNGYELRKITFQSRPGLRVTANLYVPDGSGPFPGVIGVHGHWPQGKITERVQARGHILALSGFVVLMIDAFGSGERGTVPGQFEYHGAGIGSALLDIGEPLLGIQIHDNMRGVDLLASLDYVDAGRIGVTGASGGGNQSMWLAALDPRIKAAVPVVSVGTFESYVTRTNCICEVLPNGLTFLEEWAVLGLIAPNALLMLNAMQDNPTFTAAEMIRSFNDARQVYRLYGVEDKITYQAFDLPHGYWPEMQRAMLGWFKRWLKGEGEGRPCALPDYQPLPEAECLCFPGTQRPAAVASIPKYRRPIARHLAAGHLKGAQPISRSAKCRQLVALLSRSSGDSESPTADDHTITEIGIAPQPPLRIRKLIVTSEPDILLPTVILTTQAAGPWRAATLILHPQGKSYFAKASGLKDRATRGEALILADLRGTGETSYDTAPCNNQFFHDHSRACLWLGRTMVGDWTRDILALVAGAARLLDRTPIDIIAYQETGLAALCVAALKTRIRNVTTVGMLGSYLTDGPIIGPSMAVHIPGILRWGDISMMAALAGCRVDIVNPVDGQGRPYSAAQCRALGREITRLTRRLGIQFRRRVQRARAPFDNAL